MKDIIGIDTVKGKLIIEDSDNEHIEDLIVFCKGWQKFKPQFGAEAGKYVNGNKLNKLKTEVRKNLNADNAKGVNVQVIGKAMAINGHY